MTYEDTHRCAKFPFDPIYGLAQYMCENAHHSKVGLSPIRSHVPYGSPENKTKSKIVANIFAGLKTGTRRTS